MNNKFIFHLLGMILASFIGYELIDARLYTDDELNEARIDAVELARNGDLDSALDRFEVLVKYESNNQSILHDYLVVLHWAERNREISQYLPRINRENVPSYVVDSLISTARQLIGKGFVNEANKISDFLLGQVTELTENQEHNLATLFPEKVIENITEPNVSENEVESLTESPIDNNGSNKRAQAEVDKNVALISWSKINSNESDKTITVPHHHLDRKRVLNPLQTAEIKVVIPEPVISSLNDEPLTKSEYHLWTNMLESQANNDLEKLALYQEGFRRFKDNQFILVDLITLLSWNNAHIQATELYEQYRNISFPIYTLKAVAFSYREQGHFQKARVIYLSILIKDKVDDTAALGLVHSDIGEENWSDAQTRLEKIIFNDEKKKNSVKDDALALLAFVLNQRTDSQLEKIIVYDKLLDREPDNAEIKRLKVLNLIELGVLDEAKIAIDSNDNLLTEQDKLEFYTKLNTLWIRRAIQHWEQDTSANIVDHALKINSEYINYIQKVNQKFSLENDNRIHFALADRMFLLNAVQKHEAVIGLYKEKKINIDSLPDYALAALGDSYLFLLQAHQSLHIAEFGLEKFGEDKFKFRNLAYYSALELAEADKSKAHLEFIIDSQPIWRRSKNSERKKPNQKRATIELMAVMHQAYAGDIKAAQKGIDKLLQSAPQNLEYIVSASKLNAWDHANVLAQSVLDRAFDIEQSYVPALQTQAEYDYSNNEYSKAEKSFQNLNERFPHSAQLKRSQQRMIDSKKGTLSARFGMSDSEGSNFSGKDSVVSTWYRSPIINENWRVNVFFDKKKTESEIIDVENKLTGIGANYYARNWDVTIETFKHQLDDDLGGSMNFSWNVIDNWSLSIGHSSLAKSIPLRALVTDVDSDESTISANFSDSELQIFSNYKQMKFSDGNNRQAIFVNASKRLASDIDFRLEALTNIYIEKNSQSSERFYFNPKQNLNLSVGARLSHTIFQESQKKLKQYVAFESGVQKQKNFDSRSNWSVVYQQEWVPDKDFKVHYGLGYSSKVYDGEREKGPNAFLGFEWRM